MIPNKISRLLEIHKELLDFVDTNLKQTIHDQVKTQPGFRDTCFVIFAKSTKTIRAIQYLCGKGVGYGEDAIILTRSLLELLINLAYITIPEQEQERERRAKLFANWLIIDINRKLKELKDNDPFKDKLEQRLKEFDPTGIIYNEVNNIHREECGKHKESGKNRKYRSWSGLSIKNMAEEVKLLDPYYNKVYWMYSEIVHPHPGGFSSYRKYNANRERIILTLVDLANSEWIEEALVSSFDCYIKMVELINNIFSLGLNTEIEQMANNFIKLLNED